MADLWAIRLRTLRWLVLPVVVLVVVPLSLRVGLHERAPAHWGLWQWMGTWLIANGLGLGAWCVNLFNVEGHGTPLPLDPPKRFVVSGPYRYVRNPMMLGAFLILWGEAAVFESVALLIYASVIVALAHLFVRRVEEPDLAQRFGSAYLDYKQRVPRWIPWKPSGIRKTA